ncbi:hypothetical protein U2I54_23450 [Bacillus pseudomycoides]|uniref:Uncharacterized protein n=1 Tax=Bacillus bingmayongensis TaxID=1150157 RepID=A0ABU5K2J2_9BACI|nr:hypothetical protein [Bacillus pseudomycoides]
MDIKTIYEAREGDQESDMVTAKTEILQTDREKPKKTAPISDTEELISSTIPIAASQDESTFIPDTPIKRRSEKIPVQLEVVIKKKEEPIEEKRMEKHTPQYREPAYTSTVSIVPQEQELQKNVERQWLDYHTRIGQGVRSLHRYLSFVMYRFYNEL